MPAGRTRWDVLVFIGAIAGITRLAGELRVRNRPSGSMMLRFVYSSRVRPESFFDDRAKRDEVMSL